LKSIGKGFAPETKLCRISKITWPTLASQDQIRNEGYKFGLVCEAHTKEGIKRTILLFKEAIK